MADAEEDPVVTLRGIVGLGYEACAAMLARANGDVAAAVNRHFAAHDPRGDRVLAMPSSSSSPKRSSSGAHARSGKQRRRESADTEPKAQSNIKALFGGGGGRHGTASKPECASRASDALDAPAEDACPATKREIATQDTPVVRAEAAAGASGADRDGPTMALHVIRAKPTGSNTSPPRPPGEGEAGSEANAAGNTSSGDDDLDALWPSTSASVPYAWLARLFERVSSTKKRLEKHAVLRRAFERVIAEAPGDCLAVAYLVFGRCYPSHKKNAELNVGAAAVCAAIRDVTGASNDRIARAHDKLGDLGDVAAALKRGQVTLVKPKPLAATAVLDALRNIAAASGKGSAARRRDAMLSVLRCASPEETKYFVRTLVRNMRVGANRIAVLAALAEAAEARFRTRASGDGAYTASDDDRAVRRFPEGKDVAAAAQRAYALCPDLDLLVPPLIAEGVAGAAREGRLRPGTPVKPMLASITAGVADAAAKIRGTDAGETTFFLAEYKYDGVRAQIHLFREPSDSQSRDDDDSDSASFSVRVFSRNCEDRTEAFPDVVRAFLECAKGGDYGDGLVIDAEIVGVDRQTGKLLPFQTLASRPRSFASASDATANATAVCVFVFDLLYAGDAAAEETMDGGGAFPTKEDTRPKTHDLSLRERRSRLRSALPGLGAFPGVFELARSVEVRVGPEAKPVEDSEDSIVLAAGGLKTTRDDDDDDDANLTAERAALLARRENSRANLSVIDTIERFTVDAVDAACEGLVLKRLDGARSAYAPSVRAESWLKLKRDYCETLGGAPRDSLDLVPIGAWHGNGRKAGWYSPFLLAAYDPTTETYDSVCRCMSGFTDAFYEEKTETFGKRAVGGEAAGAAGEETKTKRQPSRKKKPRKPAKPAWVNTLERPDVWFVPSEVWEVRGADLTLSPKHAAAAGARHAERGISLRFPRFVAARPDKSPEDASGPAEVLALFDAQARRWGGQEASAERRLREIQRACEEAPDAFGEEREEEEEESAGGE